MKPKPKRKRKAEAPLLIDGKEITRMARFPCCGVCVNGRMFGRPCSHCNGHGYLWRKAVKK